MAHPALAELTDRSPIYVQRSPEGLRSSQEIRGLARPLCDQPTDEVYLTPQPSLPANDITERRSHVHPHDPAFLTFRQAVQQLIDVIKKLPSVAESRWEHVAVAKDRSEWGLRPEGLYQLPSIQHDNAGCVRTTKVGLAIAEEQELSSSQDYTDEQL